MSLRSLTRAGAAAVIGACVAASASGAAVPTPAPGGSNFSWYRVDRPQPGVCNREPYGIVPNFAEPGVRAQVESELAQMIQSGQRRLRIGIFFAHGVDSGTVMNSAGGDLSAQNRENLAGFLAAIRAAGFEQIEVAFHPVEPNWAGEWTTWDESLFQENWNLIRNLRPIIAAAGVPYRIDLANEAIPGPGQTLLLEYSRRLWTSYAGAFGSDDTVGFSVIGDPAHVARIPEAYGNAPPRVFDVHFYGTGATDEYELFRSADVAMTRLGLSQPWIVGEAFYNDAIAAGRLRAALAETARPVEYLTQWPLSRGSACADVDVPAPTAFEAYQRAGFGTLPPPRSRPRPQLTTRRLAVGRRGAVPLRVRCAHAFTRCSGTVALRLRPKTFAHSFSLLPWQREVLQIRLPPALRTALRRGRRLRGTVALTAHTIDNPHAARRSVTVTLGRRVPSRKLRFRGAGTDESRR